jgi:hypothetical protein
MDRNLRILINELASRTIDEERRHWEECDRPADHTYLLLDELVKLANQ